jgi:hypothetical protein
LAKLGLQVRYYSDPDPDPSDEEVALEARAKALGVAFFAALDVVSLIRQTPPGGIAVVLYERNGQEPHFSIIEVDLGVNKPKINLPLDPQGSMSLMEFEEAWQKGGINRQALIITQLAEGA